ncbi:unknown similar to AMEV072 [Mythimna separata entomopoxvirus 'L']|uniref:Gamma-glutamylcyclotransferase n=1 Tax=Mythimna separata entomopoxvirus 'L' TaxID=1293572 RepID=A0A916KQF4_9POXV|nr:unknown similar to AMEV072 [Mythimna separata entomopoxvirus 'L']CCU56286.1 unknown similar to AMEV072 [Mythimna separata entomopoxvirus 'L']
MYKYYFGYGANQNINYLIDRYNNNDFLNYKIGIILNHSFKLCYSKKIDSVISTIVYDENNIVYGVLYEVSDSMLKLFDEQEHIDKDIYERIKLPVILPSTGNIIESYVYKAIEDKEVKMATNFNKYKNIILDAITQLNYPEWYKIFIYNKFNKYYNNANI